MAEILIVEDDASHAKLMQRALRRTPEFQVTVASTLRDARTALSQSLPDLLVVDLILPDGQGTDLLEVTQKAEPRIPTMVLTSQGNERVAVDAMKAGALDYIVKSDSILLDMPHVVDRALREWRNIQERNRAEQALRRSEAVLRSMTASSPMAFFVVDVEKDLVLYSNLQLATIWRGQEDAAPRISDHEPASQILERCYASAGISEDDYRYLSAFQRSDNAESGEREVELPDDRCLRVYTTPIVVEGDMLARMYLTEDITERKRAEAQERLRAVAMAQLNSLTRRQRQVLSLVADGCPNKTIAHRLGIRVKTVEMHRSMLMKRLGVNSAAELVRLAMQSGVVEQHLQ